MSVATRKPEILVSSFAVTLVLLAIGATLAWFTDPKILNLNGFSSTSFVLKLICPDLAPDAPASRRTVKVSNPPEVITADRPSTMVNPAGTTRPLVCKFALPSFLTVNIRVATPPPTVTLPKSATEPACAVLPSMMFVPVGSVAE